MEWAHIFKHNPYHDAKGRFSSANGAKFISPWGKHYSASLLDQGHSLGFKEASGDVRKALASSHKKFIAGLDEDQQIGLEDYTGSSAAVNTFLRTGKDKNGKELGKFANERFVKTQVDAAMAKASVGQDIQVWRGTDLKYIANKDGKILPGDIIHESAYTSTSLDRGIVEKVFAAESEHKEEPVLVSINVPSKTRGIYMDSISSYKEEKEVLLDRGTKFIIRRVSERTIGKKKIKHIELDVHEQ